MESNNKLLRIFGAMILVMIMVTACGPAATTVAPGQPTNTTAPGQPTNTTAPAEVITLDVLHFYGEGVADQPRMVEWGKQFEALYPQYKIKWTWGGSESDTLFQARYNAGDPPDIYTFNDASTAAMARLGVIQPVDKYLATQNYEGDSVWKDTFYSVIENGHIKDGALGDHYYAIPDNMHFAGIFYNKGLFAANGYQIPTTWPELLTLCDKIQKDLAIPCFSQDMSAGYLLRVLDDVIWRLMGNQIYYDTATGKEGTTFNTPEFLRAAQMFQELTTKYFVKGWEGNQWPAGQVDFANGGEAMIFMPSWLPSELMNTKAADFTMGMFPVPTIPDGYTGNPDIEVKFNGWCLPVGSKHPDDVMVLIKFLTSKAYQQDRTDKASMPSVLKAVTLPPDLANMTTYLTSQQVIRFGGGLDADAGDWERGVMHALVVDLAKGAITPEVFIQQLDTQTKAFYANKATATP